MTFERWTTAASIEIEAGHNGAALVHVVSALKALAAERAEARREDATQWSPAVIRRLPPFVREPRSISHWGMF
jgi:hypothetical protein